MALLSENGSSSNIIVRKGLCWLLRENPKYQPLFFSEALFLPAVKHTVVALKQDFLDVMLDKTGLDESTLTDLLTVQIMGCLENLMKNGADSILVLIFSLKQVMKGLFKITMLNFFCD